MTHKPNRAERRAQRKEASKTIKENKLNWDELEDCYNSANTGLALVAQLEVPIKEMLPYVDDVDYLVNTLEIIAKDTAQLKTELEDIHNSHKNRTGLATVDDVMEIISVGTAYHTWTERFAAVVEPNHDVLVDIEYRARLKEAKEKGEDTEAVTRLPSLELGA